MKLSSKSRYAVTAVYHLTKQYYDEPESVCNIKEIAEEEHVPFKFLELILQSLKNAGIVESRRGVNGGYVLTTDPATLTVGRVIRLVEGDILPFECIDGQPCIKQDECGIRDLWLDLRKAVNGVLDNRTFADLIVHVDDSQGGYI